jgi:hypothetical protein
MGNLAALGLADVLWLSSHTWTTIGAAAAVLAAVGATAFAAWQVLISILNERKRTQPVVIAHDAGGRQFGDRGNPNTVLPTYLTNEGGGAAFNVRFGVDFDGVRYAWKFSRRDSDHGAYQRVVRVGARLPEGGGSFPIEIPWEKFAIGRDTDERRVYWCRYENAYGKTWETRNPVNRSRGLDIRRVRLLRWKVRQEERRRRKIAQKARAGLRSELEAMAAEATATQQAADAEEQDRARRGEAPEGVDQSGA